MFIFSVNIYVMNLLSSPSSSSFIIAIVITIFDFGPSVPWYAGKSSPITLLLSPWITQPADVCYVPFCFVGTHSVGHATALALWCTPSTDRPD